MDIIFRHFRKILSILSDILSDKVLRNYVWKLKLTSHRCVLPPMKTRSWSGKRLWNLCQGFSKYFAVVNSLFCCFVECLKLSKQCTFWDIYSFRLCYRTSLCIRRSVTLYHLLAYGSLIHFFSVMCAVSYFSVLLG